MLNQNITVEKNISAVVPLKYSEESTSVIMAALRRTMLESYKLTNRMTSDIEA